MNSTQLAMWRRRPTKKPKIKRPNETYIVRTFVSASRKVIYVKMKCIRNRRYPWELMWDWNGLCINVKAELQSWHWNIDHFNWTTTFRDIIYALHAYVDYFGADRLHPIFIILENSGDTFEHIELNPTPVKLHSYSHRKITNRIFKTRKEFQIVKNGICGAHRIEIRIDRCATRCRLVIQGKSFRFSGTNSIHWCEFTTLANQRHMSIYRRSYVYYMISIWIGYQVQNNAWMSVVLVEEWNTNKI